MTKKELIEMLSDVPDNSPICITEQQPYILGNNAYRIDIKGFYENKGTYVLTGLNVRPYTLEKHD